MLEEDVDLVEGEDNPLVEVGLPTTVRKATIRIPQGQRKMKVALGEKGHTSKEGVMAEAEELPTNVTSATSGGVCPLSVLKVNRLDKEENMFLKQRK